MQKLVFDTKKDNIFFTSDTHFNHTNIIRYCSRPFDDSNEMDMKLVENWNNTVSENDIVFHLGDFGFGNKEYLINLANLLNGKIYLILGNHDHVEDVPGLQKRFEGVFRQAKIYVNDEGKKIPIYLNHFPFLCFDGSYKGLDATWQLFGHVHSIKGDNTGLDPQRLIHLFPSQYDVGVDRNNYTPVSFNMVKDIITEQMMSLNLLRP